MREACVWILRVSSLLLLVWSRPLDSQLTADHRKVPQRAEPQQEAPAGYEGPQGSWGSWGPWTSCSRTCGGGVQEQTRPCLPVHTPSLATHPSRRAGARPQHPGHVVSALRPVVPLHRDAGGPPPSNSSSQGELGGPQKEKERERELRPGGRRRVSHITPGRYGYGRMPYVAPLETETGPGSGTARPLRQRRSPEAEAYQPASRRHGGHRSSNWEAYNNPHQYSRPYQHPMAPKPKTNPVWASLYQPGSAQQPQIQPQPQQELYSGGQASGPQQHQERPYDPLPTSSCVGEHARYKICNNNACPPSSRHIRAVQCSSYNKQPFMGRLYEWEPFNEVPGEQHCELNCRAIGFRFYVRQSDKVIDGTPCGQNETSVCVAGQCTVGHTF